MRVLIERAPGAVLGLADVKQHLRIDGDEFDQQLTWLIDVAIEALESALKTPLRPSRFRERLRAQSSEVVLQVWGVTEVASLTVNGQSAAFEHEQHPQGWAFSGNWAAGDWIEIAYTAGFLVVPKVVLQALRLEVGTLFEHPERYVDRQAGQIEFQFLDLALSALKPEGGF